MLQNEELTLQKFYAVLSCMFNRSALRHSTKSVKKYGTCQNRMCAYLSTRPLHFCLDYIYCLFVVWPVLCDIISFISLNFLSVRLTQPAFLWICIVWLWNLTFLVSFVESDIRPGRLLTWCQKQTEGYRNVTITDLTSSWESGIALCALIHRFKPQLMYVTHIR